VSLALGRLFPREVGGRTVNTASIFGGISRDADGKVTGAKAMAFTYLLAQAASILTMALPTMVLAFSYLLTHPFPSYHPWTSA
jgi:hypothetical protein